MKKFLQRAAVALSLLTFGVFSSCTFISEREDSSSVGSGQVPVTIDLSVISQALSSMRAISADTATAASNLTIYCNAALTGVSDESYSKSKETGIALDGSTSSVQLSFNDVPAGKSYKISIGVYSESSKKGVEFASGSSESFTVAADTTSTVSVKLALNSDLQGSYFVAQGASGDGTFLNPGSIDSALSMLKSQKEGGTARIYLLSDVNYTGENAFEAPDNLSEFTFDLGGHTLTINKVLKRSDFESAPTIFSVRYCNNANIRNGTIKTDSSLDWYPSLDGLCNFDSYNDLTNPDYVYNLSDLTFSGFNMTVPPDDDYEYSILYCRGIIANVSNITITDCPGFSMAVFADATLTLSGDNNLSDLYISSQQPTTIKKDFTLNSDSCITFSAENLLFLEAALSADINVDSTMLSNESLEAQTGLFADNSYIDSDHIVLVDTLDGYYVAPSGAVLPEQELGYGCDTNGNSLLSIHYANDEYYYKVSTQLKSWRSAIDSDGQIYALYYDVVGENHIYFAGQKYDISSTDSSKLNLSVNATDPYDGVICFTIMAETGIPIISVKDSDTLKFYWVAFESDNASLTDLGSVDLSNISNNININNIAAYKNSSDQTVICFAASMQGETKYLHIETGQYGSSGYSYNEYDLSIFTYNLGNFSLEEISIPEEKVFGNADLCFQSSAAVTDMHIVKESSGSYSLYALVKDEDSHPDVVLTAYDNSDGKYIPAVARGAMLSIDLSSSSITKVYGHNLDSKSDVCALNNDEECLYFTNGFYGPGPSSSSYSAMKSLVGPAKFLAIKPKEITIADYGRKVTATGSKASEDDPDEQDVAATASRFSGKAIFSISSKDLTFNDTESFKISAQRTSESGLETATYPYMDTTNETDFSVLYLTPNAETLY